MSLSTIMCKHLGHTIMDFHVVLAQAHCILSLTICQLAASSSTHNTACTSPWLRAMTSSNKRWPSTNPGVFDCQFADTFPEGKKYVCSFIGPCTFSGRWCSLPVAFCGFFLVQKRQLDNSRVVASDFQPRHRRHFLLISLLDNLRDRKERLLLLISDKLVAFHIRFFLYNDCLAPSI